jgi:hypothetical protein
MTRKELEDLIFRSAGGKAVIQRLWYWGVDVSNMCTEDTLRTILHRCIDESSWGKAIRIIEALENVTDDTVFVVDDAKGIVDFFNDPDGLFDYVLGEDLVELED